MATARSDDADSPRNAQRLLLALSAAAFLLEIVPSFLGGYGYFIDELYYIACSERPALGYVDHPPLAPWILAASRAIFGDSVAAIRLLPALAFAGSVFLTGLMARRMGAGTFGQGLAALALTTAPVPVILSGFFSMNAFEILLWTAACLILVEIARTGDERLWLAFGLIAGIGLLNKHTFVLLAVGLAAGLVLTEMRRHLVSPWLWLGAATSAILLAPNVWWQVQNGWPSLEFYRNADELKNVPTPPLEVLFGQVLLMSPATLPVWLAGAWFCLRTPRGKRYRFLGWTFLTLLVLLMISQKSRPDRIVGAYPVMFAAGGAWWSAVIQRPGWRWTRVALPALLVVCALVLAPLSLPILPPARLGAYATTLGVVPQLERGSGKVSELPQWFADRFGWPELVDAVADAVETLEPEERERALILVPSYGHAGALELLGRDLDLPRVASPQNTYYLWGTGDGPIDVVVAVDYGPDSLSGLFEEVRQVGLYRCGICMPWRDDAPIYVARRPRVPFRDYWADFKHFE